VEDVFRKSKYKDEQREKEISWVEDTDTVQVKKVVQEVLENIASRFG
jgi:hypothetical protein